MSDNHSALGHRNNSTFVGTFKGKFTLNVPEGTPGALSRETKTGKRVIYLAFETFTGRITKVEKKAGDDFDNLHIHLEHQGKNYILSLGYMDNTTSCFWNHMENLDYSKPVTIEISEYNERTYLFFKQGGEKVPAKYTKDNKGAKPEWKKVMVNRKETWDRGDEISFFENIMEKDIQPKLRALAHLNGDGMTAAAMQEAASMEVPAAPAPVPVFSDGDAPDDDLPF